LTTYIGLSGYARAGKDSVAATLVDRLGFIRVSFADALKSAVKALDPIIGMKVKEYTPRLARLSDVWDLERTDAENWERLKHNDELNPPDEARKLLQRMGTEVGRNLFGENFWVDQAFKLVPEGTRGVVFADARFPNEALAVKAHGGEVWRITRPGYGPVNDHPSETSLDDWPFDHELLNDRRLEDLAEEAVYLIDPLKTRFPVRPGSEVTIV